MNVGTTTVKKDCEKDHEQDYESDTAYGYLICAEREGNYV